MSKLLCSTEWQWTLARNIVKGVLGVMAAHVDKLAGMVAMDATTRALVVALVMAVLSPVMTELGKHAEMPDGVATPADRDMPVETETLNSGRL